MPFSQSSQLSAIVGFAESIRPNSVLDVGTGMGQYGFLLRMNLENVHLFEVDGRRACQRPREDWNVRIDGIEGFELYRTPVHDYSYNELFFDNAMTVLPSLAAGSYELVIAVDILEHLSRDEGQVFLAQCQRIANRAVLVSTPKVFETQEVEANPLENHRSLWTEQELRAAGFEITLPNEHSWLMVHHQGSESHG